MDEDYRNSVSLQTIESRPITVSVGSGVNPNIFLLVAKFSSLPPSPPLHFPPLRSRPLKPSYRKSGEGCKLPQQRPETDRVRSAT